MRLAGSEGSPVPALFLRSRDQSPSDSARARRMMADKKGFDKKEAEKFP